jgi:hypothetical protein
MSENQISQEELFNQEVVHHIKAGYQFFYITSNEEERVLRSVCELINGPYKNDVRAHTVLVWDCVKGLQVAASRLSITDLKNNVFPGMLKEEAPVRDPIKVLDLITSGACANSEDFIVVFRDLDTVWGNNPALWRMIRNVVNGCCLINAEHRRPVFVIGNSGNVPSNIKAEVTQLDFTLPDEQMLQQIIDAAASLATTRDPNDSTKIIGAKIDRNPELEAVAVRNLLGLNCVEAENAVALALSKNKGINHGFITTIREQKAHVFRKSEVMTYIPEGTVVKKHEIAGYDRVFEFIDRRRAAYSKAAEKALLDKPKGLLLLGPAGTGKSAVAGLIGNLLEMPSYKLDVGALFGSHVGESEQKTRNILRQLSAEKGCVVILDEADKMLSGMSNTKQSSGDSGTGQRVFGQLLSFLTEQKGNIFVILTMNEIDHLPDALTRPGRFDAKFYTDLPDKEERREVLIIHFKKRGVSAEELNFSDADWESIVDATKDWSHAELEQVVVESRFIAFAHNTLAVPTAEEVLKALPCISPIAKTNPEGLKLTREICVRHAQPVTTPKSLSAALPAKRGRTVRT